MTRTIHKRLLGWSCGASIAVASTWSCAEPPADVAGSLETDRARELHNEGNALFEKGDIARARVAYLAAWNLKKHWQLASALGECERRLGLFRDAAEHLAFALRTMPVGEKRRDEVGKRLAEVKAQVGSASVAVSEAGADVSVDGAPVGKSPLADPIFLVPGEHELEITKVGFVSDSRKLSVAAGSEQQLTVVLRRTEPGAALVTPPPGGLEPAVEGDDGLPLWPSFVLGGAALVAAGVGVGFTVAANGTSGDAASLREEIGQGRCPGDSRCDEFETLSGDFDGQTNAAVGLFVAGGVFAIGAVVYAVIAATDGTPASSGRVLTPAFAAVPEPGGGARYAAALRGSF